MDGVGGGEGHLFRIVAPKFYVSSVFLSGKGVRWGERKNHLLGRDSNHDSFVVEF